MNQERLAGSLDIKLNEFGFCHSEAFKPVQTSRPGVYVCGGMNGPKDIPESVVAASGAVAGTLKFLKIGQQSRETSNGETEEINVIGERPRIGVFVCHCGINIAGVVDVKDVAAEAGKLSHVEHAENVMYACSSDCLETIKQRIKEHNLNRIVVAACTPRTHEPLFRETIHEAGLNPYLFEMANIRDQCSWAHMDEPDLATAKAKDLVEMAVAKARNLSPLERLPISVNPRALVIGGGLAGMTAALSLAEAGHEVVLVEKDKALGGHVRKLYTHLSGKDPQALLSETIQKVKKHKHIQLLVSHDIKEINGYVGNFKTTIHSPVTNKKIVVEHGAVIVATGAKEHTPSEYGYGQSTRIVTQTEFEKMIHDQTFPDGRRLRKVVMIQCVGSREPDKMVCSRVCCSDAIKNGLELKKINPRADIYVCYRDIRTYGFREKYYTNLRDKGAIFLRFDLESKPRVEVQTPGDPDSKLTVTVFDPIMEKEVVIAADLLVLSAGIDALEENSTLAKMLKVPLNADGMFLEAHVKLRPVDFATDGVFVCGLAHGPKDMDESMAQAQAAASRALSFLTKASILAEGTIAQVNTELCSGCGYCQEVCAYAAVEVNPETQTAEVNDALCKGCGTCVASCRCGALDLRGFSNKQLFSVFNELELIK